MSLYELFTDSFLLIQCFFHLVSSNTKETLTPAHKPCFWCHIFYEPAASHFLCLLAITEWGCNRKLPKPEHFHYKHKNKGATCNNHWNPKVIMCPILPIVGAHKEGLDLQSEDLCFNEGLWDGLCYKNAVIQPWSLPQHKSNLLLVEAFC